MQERRRRRVAPITGGLVLSCFLSVPSIPAGADPVLIHREPTAGEASHPKEPLDLARIQVSGAIEARLRLSESYLEGNETRLTQDRGWGADQRARWLEAMTLLARYRGAQPQKLDGAVQAFLGDQRPDGSLYLDNGDPKELWGATRTLLFLTTYYRQVKPDPRILDAAVRLADHLLARIDIPDTVETRIHGGYHAAIRGLVGLGEITGEPRFLDGARALAQVIDPEVAPPGLAKLVHSPLAEEVIHTPERAQAFAPHQHHTRSYLEAVVGLAELSRVTGDAVPLGLANRVWEATVEHTMWVSGGIPEAYGEPFEHNDETCSVASWLMLNLALFRTTGRVQYADVAEHVFLNHLLFDQAQSGGFCADRSLSPEFKVNASNRGVIADQCCSLSGPRGILEVLHYAVTGDSGGVEVSFFVPSVSKVPVGPHEVTVTVETDYPNSGTVTVGVEPPQGDLDLELRLRRPSWLLDEPTLFLNDAPIKGRLEGGYVKLHRKWRRGDRVRYEMDLPLAIVKRGGNGFNVPRITHATRSEALFEDAAILYGPLLLMLDRPRSGRLPEGDFRVSVGRGPENRLRLERLWGSESQDPFVLAKAHFISGCRGEERRTGFVPSAADARWDPVVLFPLSEITQQRELVPDEYLVRMNLEILPDRQ